MSQFSVDSSVLHVLSNGDSDITLGFFGEAEQNSIAVLLIADRFNNFGVGIVNETLLWLVLVSGEEDELLLELFESLDVDLEGFDGFILSSMINSDADASGESSTETSTFELLKGEASADSLSSVVSLCACSDGRSEEFDGSRLQSAGSFLSSDNSSLLVGGLVEESLEKTSVKMFSQVNVGNDVVVLDHF